MESDAVKRQILGFLGTVLEPVIRLVLRTGVTWKEFSELAKTKFVEVATADFGIRGRPTNVSRVAILTGLDRRDVAKLRTAPSDAPAKGYHSKASQILSAWHHEPEFLELVPRVRAALIAAYDLDSDEWVPILMGGSGLTATNVRSERSVGGTTAAVVERALRRCDHDRAQLQPREDRAGALRAPRAESSRRPQSAPRVS